MFSSHRRLMIAIALVWLAILGKWLTYGLIARYSIVTPPLFVLIAFSILLGLGGIYVFIVCTKRVFLGPSRFAACGCLVLTLTPLIWTALFVANLRQQAIDRENLDFNFTNRAIGYWSASVADVEALRTKPHRIRGEHVTLYAESPMDSAPAMVKAMDQHVEKMCEQLGCAPPKTRSRWVRGKLLGFSGRALLCWAICDTDENRLTYLDRHEVAHTLITILAGPKQDPPMLLAEGWAQVHSANISEDMSATVETLWREKVFSDYGLADLLDEETYGASISEAYFYGGPFVYWLIESFGGEKFLEIYSTVRRESWREDFATVYDCSFDELESKFWDWVDRHFPSPEPEQKNIIEPEFESEQTKEKWFRLLDQYQDSQPKPDQSVPCEFAFEFIRNVKTTNQTESTSFLFEDNGNSWMVENDDGELRYAVASDNIIVDVRRDAQGVLTGRKLFNRDRRRVQRMIDKSLDNLAGFINPRIFPVENSRDLRIVHSIREPSPDDPFWTVVETVRRDNTDLIRKSNYKLDPSHHYWLAELSLIVYQTDSENINDVDERQIELRYNTKFQFLNVGSSCIPFARKIDGFHSDPDLIDPSETSCRALDEEEKVALKNKLKRIAEEIPGDAKPWWIRYHWPIGFSLPVITIICFGLAFLRRKATKE